jgi:hypothetical protein
VTSAAALTASEAEAALAEAGELVACLEAPIADAKEVLGALLDAGVPAGLGRDPCCGGGCAPKLLVLVREDDVGRAAEVLRARWHALLDRDGVDADGTRAADADGDGEPPCPACGGVGPLVEGACADCGLQLA